MEQKTAQFLVLFNHFYPLASKNHFMVKTSYYDQDIANHNQTKIVFDVVMDMV